MTEKQKSRGGRPRKAPIATGEKVQIGVRITPKIRKRLETAIAANGRSLTQEAEHRIERSFSDEGLVVALADDGLLGAALERRFGSPIGPLLMVLGKVGQRVEFLAKNLVEDPDRKDGSPLATKPGYAAFVSAATETLKALPLGQRPSRLVVKPTQDDLTWETLAAHAVEVELLLIGFGIPSGGVK